MPTYITKADIVAWVNLQLACVNNSIEEGDLPDIIMDWGHTKILSMLINLKIKDIPEDDDDYHFLKFATMAIILDLLCKARMITQSSGDVLQDRFGDVLHSYQRANPLFFFATGSSQPFQRLLPYDTLRMYAFSLAEAYVKRAFYERTGSTIAVPRTAFDATKGGFNWDNQSEDDFDYIEEDIDIDVPYDQELGISNDEEDIENSQSDL